MMTLPNESVQEAMEKLERFISTLAVLIAEATDEQWEQVTRMMWVALSIKARLSKLEVRS